MENFLKTERIYTILELNNAIRQLIKSEFSDTIWVCGEIQDYRARKTKKHIYFNLVQKHPEADQIIAQVKAIIFEDAKYFIQKRIQASQLNFQLKDDIEVKLLCRVDLYPKWGEYRLIVLDIDPIYTIGKIAQSRQRIIEELRLKGLLEKNKLLKITSIPLKIGLITSYDSAAYHDFISELKLSGYGFKIFLYNCYMQGKYVEKDILSALNFFNQFSKEELDLIVITRGGGSTAELSAFDNRYIAEAVALSKFPVISALGHQINVTITDMVAHTSLKTPTKVAQFLVEMVREFMDNINLVEERIVKISQDYLLKKRKELEGCVLKLDSILPRYFRFHREELIRKRLAITNYLKIFLNEKKNQITEYLNDLKSCSQKILKNSYEYIGYLKDKIKLLDPKNILKRGYSITFKGKKVIKSSEEVKEEDTITTVLYKGRITSKVKKID
jgi:exodeoxyribonuclease VII large subunit